MNTSTIEFSEALASKVWTKGSLVYLQLTDGRIIGFPSKRFRLLKDATEQQLANVKLQLNGAALRWDELDEDLTVQGIIEGKI